MKSFKIGLLYFQEMFARDLEFRLNQMAPQINSKGEKIQIQASHVNIEEFNLEHQFDYDLIIDRASHYFRLGIPMFMMMAYKGIRIVNNPFSFHFFIDRKDVGYKIAHELGVDVPPTCVLPVCKTPFLKESDFVYHKHFNWGKIIEQTGFPCFIKPANGRGARGVHKCHNKMELIKAYNESGSEIMVVQSCVQSPYPWQIRCICLGEEILICKYIFREQDQSEYLQDPPKLKEKTLQTILENTRIINRSMGYEMNSIEFILNEKEEPIAIDFNNPIPDGRHCALGEIWYEKYLQAFLNFIRKCVDKSPETIPFIPEVNLFSEIARMKISREKKRKKTLEHILASQ